MFGLCAVRYGKAVKGSPPRRRSVLTTMAWSAEVLGEYVQEVRPHNSGPRDPGSGPRRPRRARIVDDSS
jgi:hypothetical protein